MWGAQLIVPMLTLVQGFVISSAGFRSLA